MDDRLRNLKQTRILIFDVIPGFGNRQAEIDRLLAGNPCDPEPPCETAMWITGKS